MKIHYLFCVLIAFSSSAYAKEITGMPPRETNAKITGAIQIGNGTIGVDTKGKVTVNTPTGQVVIEDSIGVTEQGPTDIHLDPDLINGPGRTALSQNNARFPYSPAFGTAGRQLPNRLSAYFSTASGGFGFRIKFDRHISPTVSAVMAPEFLTYSLHRSAQILGDQMPANTTRITLISIPLGLERQFYTSSDIVPRVGFGVGPIVRFDHRPGTSSARYNQAYTGNQILYQEDMLGFTWPILTEDYPDISATLGAHVAAGLDIKLGEKKNYALSVEGRYALARFTDALGSPGDFSGFSVGIGFGKHF